MDRRPTEPLTTEEAKALLRQAAAHMGITQWVRRRPFGAVVTGVLAGFLVGRMPRLWAHLSNSPMGRSMMDRLV